MAEQQRRRSIQLFSFLFCFSCSSKNTSRYDKPFTLHPAVSSSALALHPGPRRRLSLEQGVEFPCFCSVPEPGLTHGPRMSARSSLSWLLAPGSARQIGNPPPWHVGSPAGPAPHRMRSDILRAAQFGVQVNNNRTPCWLGSLQSSYGTDCPEENKSA